MLSLRNAWLTLTKIPSVISNVQIRLCLLAVKHPFVEVDVDDGGAALDLLARDGQALVEFSFEDELGESGRAGDVGPFADEGERNFGAEGEGFESGVLGRREIWN